MTGPWNYAGRLPVVGDAHSAAVTVIDGSTFCISDRAGDVTPRGVNGLFLRDRRVLSDWCLRVEGLPLEPVTVHHDEPHTARFLARLPPPAGQADSRLLVSRTRSLHAGLVERITLHNTAHHRFRGVVELAVAADFAGLFDVKEQRTDGLTAHGPQEADGSLLLRPPDPARGAEALAVAADPAPSHAGRGGLRWTVDVPGQGRWECVVAVHPQSTAQLGEVLAPDPAAPGVAAERLHRWRSDAPSVATADPALAATLRRSIEDIGALRIFDAGHPERTVLAAGAPWFMAVFGRDSLLTACMLLPLSTDLAVGVLRTLAAQQGTRVDSTSEEQPGRIPHEIRFGAAGHPDVYYGTADATPLFVLVLGELARWTGITPAVRDLLPAADRALEWIERHGDRDGDGFVEYERLGPTGLVNQGWKDSWDGVPTATGTPAAPPIALVEVQAYCYGAYRARAELATALGDHDGAAHWGARAERLRSRFETAFWLPGSRRYALALDAAKTPIDVACSNVGHALWTGIVDPAHAQDVADLLLGPQLFTGWGVRTLGCDAAAYNPMSYHNGSVWPHDTALAAAGLRRYGFADHARRITAGLLDAATHFGHRLPELFCGFDRANFPAPVPYPSSCSPQAWAAAAPVLLLRTMLGLSPDVLRETVHCDPDVPATMLPLHLEGIAIGRDRVGVEVDAHGTRVTGLHLAATGGPAVPVPHS